MYYHRSGSAECSSLRKETETLPYLREHKVSYRGTKKKAEGLTINTSYVEAANNNSNAGSISQDMVAKYKEIAELKKTPARTLSGSWSVPLDSNRSSSTGRWEQAMENAVSKTSHEKSMGSEGEDSLPS